MIWLKSKRLRWGCMSSKSGFFRRTCRISSPHERIRDLNSAAAFLVKVVAKILEGLTSATYMNFNTFKTMTVVFPEPGPATENWDSVMGALIALF